MPEPTGARERHPAATVGLLAESLRRDLYQFVRLALRPVTRDEAAAHAGISRRLAAFHLDKLVGAGLLRAHTDMPAAGVGRRPKVYEPAPGEVAVSVPARHYDLLARLLLDAVATTRTRAAAAQPSAGDVVAEAARDTARRTGTEAGIATRQDTRPGRVGPERALTMAADVLEANGYEPLRVDPRHVVLRNCPFHRLAGHARELVCGISHAYCVGLLDGLNARAAVAADLDPVSGQCCVQLRAR